MLIFPVTEANVVSGNAGEGIVITHFAGFATLEGNTIGLIKPAKA